MLAGNRPILSSGLIVTQHGDDSVEISHLDLRFKILFETDDSKKPALRAEGEGQLLTLHLVNFDNPLGIAWSSEVGSFKEKKLFLALFIAAIVGDDPTKINRLSDDAARVVSSSFLIIYRL